jgi:hypothetical protein
MQIFKVNSDAESQSGSSKRLFRSLLKTAPGKSRQTRERGGDGWAGRGGGRGDDTGQESNKGRGRRPIEYYEFS